MGRAAYLFAANWPERLENLVTVSVPYGAENPNQVLPPDQRKAYWYQWFFGTEQARYALQEDRNSLCRYLWKTWGAAQLLTPPISVATILLCGADDGAVLPPSIEGKESLFTGGYRALTPPGVGHSVQLEQPEAVVRAVLGEPAE